MLRSRVPTRLGSLPSLLTHESDGELTDVYRLVLTFLIGVVLRTTDSSEPVAASAARWDHVGDLLLAHFHLVRIVEEAGFGTGLVLSVVESALLHCRLSVRHVCVSSRARCHSSHVGRVAIFSLHWLCNCCLVQVHHQIVIDGILVWRLRVVGGSCASGLSSSLIGSDPLICGGFLTFAGCLYSIISY